MANILYPITYTPEETLTYAYRAAMPMRLDCPVFAGGLLLNESDSWNCNLCGSDKPFFEPFVRGDVLPFQTRFTDNYNVDPSILIGGIKSSLGAEFYVMIELQEENGTTITDLADDFCESYYVGYDVNLGSFQTWFVNTALFPLNMKCFRLKITYYKIDQITLLKTIERVVFTEYYKEVECNQETVLIQSSYSSFDCFNNYYGTLTNTLGSLPIPYYNSMRLFGEVEQIGETESTTENDKGTVISKEIISNYQVVSGLYAPYYARKLSQAVRGNRVTVDNVVYKNFNFDKNNDGSKMWAIDLTFDKQCEIDNRQCNF